MNRLRLPLGRRAYFLWGVTLFAIKYNVDRFVAQGLFGQKWNVWDYMTPLRALSPVREVPPGWDVARFYALLLLISLPFIAGGVLLTIRRLRDAGLSTALVALVFIPFVKVLFFLILCAIPGRLERIESPRWPTRRNPWLPDSSLGSAVFGILVSAIVGTVFVAFGTLLLGGYGWSLFVGLPFLMGLTTVWIASKSRPLRRGEAIALALLPILVCGALLLILAAEGIVCLLMAAPLAIPLAALGGWVAHAAQGNRAVALPTTPVAGLILLTPLLMIIEGSPKAPAYAVTTALEIDAPPEAVWNHVVKFSELPPPREWIFRAGIAYPKRARIVGRGPGAVRYCEFSTGPFVEPIEVWDPPRRLRFSVTENPAPMEEWTPYRRIDPPHLHGFLVSQEGQFALIPLDHGRTRLEGTTWYRHSLWPATYWRIWSDQIIHRIHRRVLEHIRREAEGASF